VLRLKFVYLLGNINFVELHENLLGFFLTCNNLVRKLREKKMPGRPRRRWKDNIKIDVE
jgi:hypothetical protein